MAGCAVLERTLSVFEAHPIVESIILVVGEDDLIEARVAAAQFGKIAAVVLGGDTRAQSVRRGLGSLPAGTAVVLVHDAARPLVSSEVISRVIEGTLRVGAAVPGLPLSDTVKRVAPDGVVRETVPRAVEIDGVRLEGLTTVQTPQGAMADLLLAAYEAFDFDSGEPTDEASLLEAFGASVAVVTGDPDNIKITRQEDVPLAERLIASKATSEVSPLGANVPNGEIRTGIGYDVHAFAAPEAERKLFLGGVEIPHDRGLEGHSDADVLLHAICDALLGAASLGDIGILFPNTDDSYRGISSLRLLSTVGQRLAQSGWRVLNVDASVVAEAPKLMPHRAAMQRAIAESLGLESGRISVKATTNEQMGFVGRREGIAAWAIATLSAV